MSKDNPSQTSTYTGYEFEIVEGMPGEIGAAIDRLTDAMHKAADLLTLTSMPAPSYRIAADDR